MSDSVSDVEAMIDFCLQGKRGFSEGIELR